MHIEVEGRHLAKALKTVKTVIERRNTIPILSMVRITLNVGRITVAGTDLDMELSAQIDIISASDTFDMVIPASLLYEAVRFAGSAVVRIEDREDVAEPERPGRKNEKPTVLKSIVVTIGDGDQEYRFLQQSKPDDWPELLPASPTMPTELETFTNGLLRDLLDVAAQCISTEETRYYLNGVFWQGTGAFTATDGRRLASRTYKPTSEAAVSEIIPRKAVAILREIAGGDVRTYSVGTCKLAFVAGNMRLVTKTIDGTFPDYNRVIPKQEPGDFLFVFEAERLKDALARAIAFYRGQGRTALAFKQGKAADIIVSGNSGYEPFMRTETSFTAKTFAPWPDQMEAPTFGLNMHYLNTFVPKTGTVTLRVKDAGSPILVQIEGEEDVTRVIMPMRV